MLKTTNPVHPCWPPWRVQHSRNATTSSSTGICPPSSRLFDSRVILGPRNWSSYWVVWQPSYPQNGGATVEYRWFRSWWWKLSVHYLFSTPVKEILETSYVNRSTPNINFTQLNHHLEFQPTPAMGSPQSTGGSRAPWRPVKHPDKSTRKSV